MQMTDPLALSARVFAELANARTHGSNADSDSSASSAGSSDEEEASRSSGAGPSTTAGSGKVAVTGSLPKFQHSMIRERVSVRGVIRPMEAVEECETFVGLDLQEVGAVHGSGPILKWCVLLVWSVTYARGSLTSFALRTQAGRPRGVGLQVLEGAQPVPVHQAR